MKPSLKLAATVSSALALATGLLVTGAGASLAADPPYEPDSTHQIGQLLFFDADGHRVTSGSTQGAPFAKYVAATNDDPQSGNTTGTLYGYLPVSGQDPADWSGEQLSGTTTFPVANAPGTVANAGPHQPVVTGAATDLTLNDLATDYPNSATGAYQGLYQLRVLTPGNNKWWAADIVISGDSWTQVYPGGPATAPTGSVALKGKIRVGTKARCVPSFSNATSYAYRWLVDGSRIRHASEHTYVIPKKLKGHKLACRVTAKGPGGSTTEKSAARKVRGAA